MVGQVPNHANTGDKDLIHLEPLCLHAKEVLYLLYTKAHTSTTFSSIDCLQINISPETS